MLPLSTRGVAWCDIEDDELPEPKTDTTVESIKVDQSPSKSKRKPRKVKERPVDVSSPNHQPAGASVQVALGDLGLHCTAWNQATSPTSPTSPQGAWAQKPLEVMSTAPMGMAPMEKRAPPVFLPPGAFSSPMAGGKHLGDASSRMVTGTSPNMQLPHPDQMRFLPPGSPGAQTGMAPTPKGLWDASCRTPVNTPVAMSWPDSPPEGSREHGRHLRLQVHHRWALGALLPMLFVSSSETRQCQQVRNWQPGFRRPHQRVMRIEDFRFPVADRAWVHLRT